MSFITNTRRGRARLARRAFGDDLDPQSDITTTDAATAQETSPGPGFVSTNGICKPTGSASLELFKDLQRQMNRCLDAMGSAKIAVDGAIGPGTLAALQAISNAPSAGAYGLGSSSGFVVNTNDCTSVSNQVLSITTKLSQLADYMGAAASVSSPSPASTPTTVNPVTGVETPQPLTASVMDTLNNMSTTEKLGVAGLAVAVGYFAITKGKR